MTINFITRRQGISMISSTILFGPTLVACDDVAEIDLTLQAISAVVSLGTNVINDYIQPLLPGIQSIAEIAPEVRQLAAKFGLDIDQAELIVSKIGKEQTIKATLGEVPLWCQKNISQKPVNEYRCIVRNKGSITYKQGGIYLSLKDEQTGEVQEYRTSHYVDILPGVDEIITGTFHDDIEGWGVKSLYLHDDNSGKTASANNIIVVPFQLFH